MNFINELSQLIIDFRGYSSVPAEDQTGLENFLCQKCIEKMVLILRDTAVKHNKTMQAKLTRWANALEKSNDVDKFVDAINRDFMAVL